MSIWAEVAAHQSLTMTLVYAVGITATLRCLMRPLNMPYKKTVNIVLLSLAALMVWRLGTFPIEWGMGTDRNNYAGNFLKIQDQGIEIKETMNDRLFYVLAKMLSFASVETYFVIVAGIYIGCYALACRRLAGSNAAMLFVAAMLSMGFMSYGTNTIRAGLAFSLVMLGIAASGRVRPMAVLFVCAALIHFSTVIPVAAFLISKYYDKTRLYFLLWVLAIPVSFAAGETFNTLLGELTIDDRTAYLIQENAAYRQGFRVDFILYSALPLLVGYWYIFKSGFVSALYRNLYNTYIITNIFWVLVIRANFTDRIAYLSWFLIPFVLAYPLLKSPDVFKNANLKMAAILGGEMLFMTML